MCNIIRIVLLQEYYKQALIKIVYLTLHYLLDSQTSRYILVKYQFNKFLYNLHLFSMYCSFGLSFNRVICTLPTIEFQKPKLSNKNLY